MMTGRRKEVELENPEIPIVRLCELFDMSQTTFCYQPLREDTEDEILWTNLDGEFAARSFKGLRIFNHARSK